MIDLHTHSTVSDGTDTPSILINKAHSQGITTIGLSDHDSIDGWQSAMEALRPRMNLVLGAEVSTLTQDGLSVHILALLFDGENKDMKTMLDVTRDERLPRMRKMIELLNLDGISVTLEDVMNATPPGATVGRPHLADALVNLGYIKNRDEGFKELLNNDSKYYVAHLAPTPIDAVKIIRRAGGVAVIAHPYASFRGQALSPASFTPLVKAGLNGIEVDHRDQNEQEREILRNIAEELDIVITGSSDYHGTGKLNSLGENVTSPAQWERLESEAEARRVICK